MRRRHEHDENVVPVARMRVAASGGGDAKPGAAAVVRWFRIAAMPGDEKRLGGRTVVVTRPRAQAGDLIEMLEAEGAEVILAPLIRIEPPTDMEALRTAARSPESFDWIVFTSANGVDRFWTAMKDEGNDTRSLAGVSLGAVGAATVRAIERMGARADLVPRTFVAESMVESFRARGDILGKRILLPRAETARSVLPDALRGMGARVHEVATHRTMSEASGADTLARRLSDGEIDYLTFASSSSARNFARLVSSTIGRAAVATIGPVTTETVRELGWDVAVEAEVHTAIGLCTALAEHAVREKR